MTSLRSALVERFGNPRGPLGWVAGMIMSVRQSNRERNRRTLELLKLLKTGSSAITTSVGHVATARSLASCCVP